MALWNQPELFMNRRDDRAGPLFATNACDEGRNRAYGRLSKDLLQAKKPPGSPRKTRSGFCGVGAWARQHL